MTAEDPRAPDPTLRVQYSAWPGRSPWQGVKAVQFGSRANKPSEGANVHLYHPCMFLCRQVSRKVLYTLRLRQEISMICQTTALEQKTFGNRVGNVPCHV